MKKIKYNRAVRTSSKLLSHFQHHAL